MIIFTCLVTQTRTVPCVETMEDKKLKYATWGEMERTYLEKHLGASLDNSALVCMKHFLEAKRHCQNSEHIPSWKSKAKFADLSGLPLTERCSNPKCENTSPQRLICLQQMTNWLKYSKLNIQRNHLSSVDNVITRHMPQFVPFHAALVELIQKLVPLLVDTAQMLSRFHSTCQTLLVKLLLLPLSDNICFDCYKTHCSIIESFKSQHGSDTMLQHSIHEWVSKKTDNSTNRLTKAILDTVIYVANNLLLGKLYCYHGLAKHFCMHMMLNIPVV